MEGQEAYSRFCEPSVEFVLESVLIEHDLEWKGRQFDRDLWHDGLLSITLKRSTHVGHTVLESCRVT